VNNRKSVEKRLHIIEKGVVEKLENERKSQIERWGCNDHKDIEWLSILVEEVGEAARAINDSDDDDDLDYEKLELELIQSAAVCIAWLECLRTRETHINNKNYFSKMFKKEKSEQKDV